MTQYLKIFVAVLTLGVLGGLSAVSAEPELNWRTDAQTFFNEVANQADVPD